MKTNSILFLLGNAFAMVALVVLAFGVFPSGALQVLLCMGVVWAGANMVGVYDGGLRQYRQEHPKKTVDVEPPFYRAA